MDIGLVKFANHEIHNNHMHSGSKNLRSFLALLFAAGDVINLSTGDYIMDMGGGDKMNLTSGDYLMNMGGGDLMNLSTGGITWSFD
mgnify:CR=1 FL=1